MIATFRMSWRRFGRGIARPLYVRSLRTMKVARLALAGLAATWAISISACTQDEGWVITSFQSDITIAKDSLLTVKEDINVDFGSELKHGSVRAIPLRYRFADNDDRCFTLSVHFVTDGTRPVTYDDYADN